MKNLKSFIQLTEDAKKSYLMSKTYETWDEEALTHGETNVRGFEYENQEFDSIWEMAKEIRDAGATEPSSSGSNVKPNSRMWYSTPDADENYTTGEKTYYSFHPKVTDEEAVELAALLKMDKKQFNDAEPGMNESTVNENEMRNARLILPAMVQVSDNSKLTNIVANNIASKLEGKELQDFQDWIKIVFSKQLSAKKRNQWPIGPHNS